MSLKGWIKIHRSLSDHMIASDPSTLSVWIHLLLLANHKETKRMINGRVVVVQAGQLITSRKSLSAKTGVNESKVERILSILKSEQQIEQHGTSKFRVISIVKWGEYQLDEQQDEQQIDSKRTADEQQMNTPGEVSSDTKNGKNVENKESLVSTTIFESAWKLYPKREGSNPKKSAEGAWNARIKEGESEQVMLDGLSRYVTFCDVKENTGTSYVMQGARFFGTKKEYLGDWKVAAPKASRHNGFSTTDYLAGVELDEFGQATI